MSPRIDAFIVADRRFQAWVDACASPQQGTIRELHASLALLQAAATMLPAPPYDRVDAEELADEDEAEQLESHSVRHKALIAQLSVLPIDGYDVVFSPLHKAGEDSGPVTTSLRDDLADTYLDLDEGFAHFDAGRVNLALWTWNQSFDSHWSRHLSHAQTALSEYLMYDVSRVPLEPA